MQLFTRRAGPVFEPLLAPRDIDENLLHRGGGRFEEMSPVGEGLVAVAGDLQPGLMHQRRRLQGLSQFFIGQAHRRQLAQFLIDQRQQLVGGLRFTCFNGVEPASDVGHGAIVRRSLRKTSTHIPLQKR